MQRAKGELVEAGEKEQKHQEREYQKREKKAENIKEKRTAKTEPKTEEQAMDNLWLELPWWFI